MTLDEAIARLKLKASHNGQGHIVLTAAEAAEIIVVLETVQREKKASKEDLVQRLKDAWSSQ